MLTNTEDVKAETPVSMRLWAFRLGVAVRWASITVSFPGDIGDAARRHTKKACGLPVKMNEMTLKENDDDAFVSCIAGCGGDPRG